jgi:TetR/AcrR family transcriptional repressor of nem operon
LIVYFLEFFTQYCKDILEDSTRSPLGKLERLLDGFMELFDSKAYTCGCPVGNLAQELGDLSPDCCLQMTVRIFYVTEIN